MYCGPQLASSRAKETRAAEDTSQGHIVSALPTPVRMHYLRPHMRLLLRFVKLKPAPEENAMDVDATNGAVDYPPTINIQNEVVRFQVRPSRSVCSIATHFRQYSHNDDTPWFILLDIVTARSSKDMIPFRTGTGPSDFDSPSQHTHLLERLGTTTFACIVGISSSTPEERRKILVHIGTCLTLNASSSLKYVPFCHIPCLACICFTDHAQSRGGK